MPRQAEDQQDEQEYYDWAGERYPSGHSIIFNHAGTLFIDKHNKHTHNGKERERDRESVKDRKEGRGEEHDKRRVEISVNGKVEQRDRKEIWFD